MRTKQPAAMIPRPVREEKRKGRNRFNITVVGKFFYGQFYVVTPMVY